MMSAQNEQGGARVRFPPPLVFLGFILVGVALRYLRPLATGAAPVALLAVGIAAAVAALALGFWAINLFRRTGQHPRPWLPTPELIIEGPYRYTRNPMYAGMFLLQIAIGIAFDNLWIVGLAPVSLAAVYFIAVRPEEAYLEEKFGESYRRYKASVRRYL